MITWFNWAQLDLQKNLIKTYENWFVTATAIDIVANQEEYAMPSGCIKVVRVEDIENTSAPIEVIPITFNDKDKNVFRYNVNLTAAGRVSTYSIKGNNFIFRPRPSVAAASGVRVYYARRVPWLNSASSCSTIPDEFHEMLTYGLVEHALIKQEATTEAQAAVLGRYRRLMKDLVSTGENRQVQRSRKVKKRRGY